MRSRSGLSALNVNLTRCGSSTSTFSTNCDSTVRNDRRPSFRNSSISEQHIVGGHGRAVRKANLRPHVEDHPGLVLGIFDGFADQAVKRADLVRRAGHHVFVGNVGQCGRAALFRVGVEAVEGSIGSDGNLAPLGRVGVHIVQMREIRRIFRRLAKGRDAVRPDDLALALGQRRSAKHHPQRQRGKRPSSTAIVRHTRQRHPSLLFCRTGRHRSRPSYRPPGTAIKLRMRESP